MKWCKVFLMFSINLMTLSLNGAQESGESEDSSPATSNINLYSSFPFGLIFGQPSAKNGTLHQHKGIKVYDNDGKDLDKPRAVYWIPYSCDSLLERGYTCHSCTESLHCMGGNFALKAICYGRRPFCYNGVCSDLRSAKCGGNYGAHDHDASEEVEGLPANFTTTVSRDSRMSEVKEN